MLNRKQNTTLKAILLIIVIAFVIVCNIIYIDPSFITLIVLGAVVVLYITEFIPLALTAVSIPIVLNCAGVITVKQTFSGISNENVILFLAMFIVGGAMFSTGVADIFGKIVINLADESERKIIAYIMIVAGVMSSVMSNTGTVAVMLPVCIGIADNAGFRRMNLLMPLAMISSLGGMITLAGTPPNATVASVLTEMGYRGFGFFEYAYIGVPLSIIGGLYLFIFYGRKHSCSKTRFGKGKNIHQKASVKFNREQKTAIAILIGVVVVMASGIINLAIASVIGAALCVITKIVTPQKACEYIDWETIFLFVGTLPLATAMDTTCAGKMIAEVAVSFLGECPNQYSVLSVLFAISAGLTQFMSNTASATLLAPIGVKIAVALGANPRGVLMVIGIAASSAFCTPIATPPNTLVMGSAKAKFTDYIKMGFPLLCISYVVCIIIAPNVWPLF